MRTSPPPVTRRFVVAALTAALTAALASCTDRTLAPNDVQLRLRNVSADSIAFQAMDRERSNLVDPYPGPISAASFGARLVAPGTTVTVVGTAIDGFRVGADVRLFLYRVSAGRATFDRTFDIAGGQIVGSDNPVELPRLSLTQ